MLHHVTPVHNSTIAATAAAQVSREVVTARPGIRAVSVEMPSTNCASDASSRPKSARHAGHIATCSSTTRRSSADSSPSEKSTSALAYSEQASRISDHPASNVVIPLHQLLRQLSSRGPQPPANRRLRHADNLGDLPRVQSRKIAHYDQCSIFVSQCPSTVSTSPFNSLNACGREAWRPAAASAADRGQRRP